MKYIYEAETKEEAAMLLHAAEAWSALSEIYSTCRNQLKHGEPDSNVAVLEQIKLIALQTRERIE